MAIGLLVAGFGAGVAQEKHDTTGNGDFFVGPDYEIDPDLKDKGYPKGQSFEFSMPSNSSCRCRAPKSED
jgi:hypothetical protein